LRATGVVQGDDRVVKTRLAAELVRVGPVHARADVRLGREPTPFRLALATSGLDVKALVPEAPLTGVRGRTRVRGTSAPDDTRLDYAAKLTGTGTPAGDVALARGRPRARIGARGRVGRSTRRASARPATGTLDVDQGRVDARVRATTELGTLGPRFDLPLAGRSTVTADVRGPFASPSVMATIEATEPAYGETRLANLSVTATLERRAEGVRSEITRLVVVPKTGAPIRLAAPTVLTIGETIVLAPATLASPDGRLTVGGRLGPGAAVDVRIGLAGVDLPRLCETYALGRCTGMLEARATLTGAGPAPRLDARVEHSIGAALVATGTAPIPWPSGAPSLDRIPFTLAVRADGFDVAALQPLAGGSLLHLRGRLDVAASVAGPLHAPKFDGTLRLHDGVIEPLATRVRYENVELALRLEHDTILIDRIAARAGGTLEGSARVALDGTKPGRVDGRLVFDRLRVASIPALEADAAGELKIEGTPDAPIVRGTIDIPHALVRPAALPSSDVPRAPDPTIEVVGRAAPPPEAPAPPVVDALTLELDVRLGDDAIVRRADARIDLGGRLRVTKAPDGPLLVFGDLRLERGWAEFQGRRFTVTPSAIHFDGPPDRPSLDVTATSQVGEYEVTVRVSGPVEKPLLTLSSEPPLPESDVLAVLVFGSPAQDLGQNQQAELQQRAIGLATNYAAGGLTRSFRETLGLDLFNVAVGSGSTPGEIRIGRYVTDDVFVSIAQEFGSRVGQVASIAYRLRPRISVRLSTSTAGSSAVDVLWHRRY
jgi:autotransporter translocation and assembly factor TamB